LWISGELRIKAYRRLIVLFAAAALLSLAAACAGQPRHDLSTPTPTPRSLPTLDLPQTTPTPEILLLPGRQIPDSAQVLPLNTMPRRLTLKDADAGSLAVEFYPSPQPGKAALLLVSASANELASWRLLAQTAQVKGLAALVLELPQTGAASQAVNAAVQWLAAPENGAFERIVTAGSGPGTGLILAASGAGAEIRGLVLFSPQAEDIVGQAPGRPVLIVESSADGAVKAGDSVEVLSGPGTGQGVEGLLSQVGVMDKVLEWCLGKLVDWS
jgi:hypothetical protein